MYLPEINILIISKDKKFIKDINNISFNKKYLLNISYYFPPIEKVDIQNIEDINALVCSKKVKKVIEEKYKTKKRSYLWIALIKSYDQNNIEKIVLNGSYGYVEKENYQSICHALEFIYNTKMLYREKLNEFEKEITKKLIVNINHNINNALFPITSSLAKLSREYKSKPDDKLYQYVKMMEKNVLKIKKYIRKVSIMM